MKTEKIIRKDKRNTTDPHNRILADQYTLESFILYRKAVGSAFHQGVNMDAFIKKMFIFKCMDFGMVNDEVMALFGYKSSSMNKWRTKFNNYRKGHVILYPYFIVGVDTNAQLCIAIKKFKSYQGKKWLLV